jgi:hypothetical protein
MMEALKDDPDQAGALLILVDLPADFLKAVAFKPRSPHPAADQAPPLAAHPHS